ncbi:MAG: thermitase [Actinomycetota bacterium]|jgi:thermitase
MRLRSAAAGVVIAVAVLVGAALPARADSFDPAFAQRLLVTFSSESARLAALDRFGGQSVGAASWAINADPSVISGLRGIRSVGPDAIVHAALTPNDPCLTTCDGGKIQWYPALVGAPSAWDRTQGGGVTIAILDSGIDAAHSDLAGKVVGSVDFTDVHDGNGQHGTDVAGVAGASTNNGIGIAGLGFNANLLSIKVLDQDGTGLTSWVINGITEAVNRGAEIINLSLAGTTYEQPLQDAINFAYAHGVLVVAAAGNNDDEGSATTPKFPAAMDHVLSVAATMQNDTIATFSRRGPWVDIAAPGNGLVTTQVGGGYTIASGTSLSAPVVAGAAALLIAQGFESSPDAITAQLVRTAVPINDGVGGVIRRLNVGAATAQAAPYGIGFGGGVGVAIGDVTAASAGSEIVTAAGPGGGPHVRVFSSSMNPLGGGFYAYGANFSGGVDVAVGDAVAESPGDEIVTGAGPGAAPHVRTFLGDGSPAPGGPGSGFYAYGEGFHGGVMVAVGDVRPDVPGEEIVTGAGAGGGPHVRVFSADGTPLDGGGFFAFDAAFHNGVQVAVGNFDGGDGMEIAVAAGPGGGPHVRTFRGDGSPISGGFFAYAQNFNGGVDIASAQLDGGLDEIVTVPRSGGGPHVRPFRSDGAPIGGGVFGFAGSVTTGLSVASEDGLVVIGTRQAPALVRALPNSALT